jgi:hypothetical protein
MIEGFYGAWVEDRVVCRGVLPGGVATKVMRNYVGSPVSTFVINKRAFEDR